VDHSSIVSDARELFRSGTPGPQVTPIFYCQCPSLWGSLTTFHSLLTGISVLTARTRTLIHPRPFQVNQIALRRIISRLGRPSTRFVLTRNPTGAPSAQAVSDSAPLLNPSSSAASLHSRARQPVGTRSAHIPRRVVPNRRRVRWLFASVSPGHGVLRPRISIGEVITSSRFEPAGT
jgi:hypothetical protein